MTSQIDSALETFTFPSKVDQAAIFGRRWLPPCGIRCTTAVTGWVHGRWHARGTDTDMVTNRCLKARPSSKRKWQ
jgi:hypothetical protein